MLTDPDNTNPTELPDQDKATTSPENTQKPHNPSERKDLGQPTPEAESSPENAPTKKVRKRRRKPRQDAKEARLIGRKAICKGIPDIAQHMLKTVKLRVLSTVCETTRGLDDEALTQTIVSKRKEFSDGKRILREFENLDSDVDRRNLKAIIILGVLLQEETYSLEEKRLDEKVISFEKQLVERSRSLDFFDPKKHDPKRWHYYDTYRIVMDAAWRNDGQVSQDEANLLRALREHLSISLEEHWLIGCYLKRFPKKNCTLHNRDEVNDARKELQREALLWSYRDENNRNIDVIPDEIVNTIRNRIASQELQRVNYRRMLNHDNVLLTDLRDVLIQRGMDRYGNKSELIDRLADSDIRPSEVLDSLDRSKLSDMCAHVGLKSSGNKPDLKTRLIDFYDDLTFEERVTKDPREEWFNNYELLASRAYSDLKAKKLINKDLDIEHQFEKATDFLFEVALGIKTDKSRKTTKADGRIILDKKRVILWDCKSVENQVNLHDHLDRQFDTYVRQEREKGFEPLAFLVIGPQFTPQSIKLAHQYKARTNCDVALVTAEALKELADQWQAIEGSKSFPVEVLNRTELIDHDRVAFLISLT